MAQKQARLLLPITTRGRLYASVREPSNENKWLPWWQSEINVSWLPLQISHPFLWSLCGFVEQKVWAIICSSSWPLAFQINGIQGSSSPHGWVIINLLCGLRVLHWNQLRMLVLAQTTWIVHKGRSQPLIGVGDHCLILQGVCLGTPHCKVLAGLTAVWGKLILLHPLWEEWVRCGSSGTSWITLWLIRLTGIVALSGPLDLFVLGDPFLLSFWDGCVLLVISTAVDKRRRVIKIQLDDTSKLLWRIKRDHLKSDKPHVFWQIPNKNLTF